MNARKAGVARQIFGALMLFAVSASAARAQTAPGQSDDLVRRADVIVIGKVAHTKSAWNADRSRITTTVTLSVDQSLKGGAPGTVTIVSLGGEVDGVGEWYSHAAQFKLDEEVLVYAQRDAQGKLRVSSGNRGKISIQRDEKTGRRVLPDGLPLERLVSQIKEAAAQLETN